MNVRDIDVPVPGPEEVLLRVAYSGICGSELSGFLGQNSLRTPPLVFGHELAGWIHALGERVDDSTLAPGTAVTANPLVSCGRCAYCVTGRHQLCGRRLLLGASLPGSNSEYVLVPATAIEPLPVGMPLQDACLTEPAACAVHAVSAADVDPATSALVLGAGPIGLFILQVLAVHGVTDLFVADPNPERRKMAEALGARSVSETSEELLNGLKTATGKAAVDVVFDAAGTRQSRANALAAVAPSGRVMLVGLHSNETELPLNTAVRNEVSITGVFAYTPADFRTALRWLAEHRIGLAGGVVESNLADGPQWYRRLIDGDPTAKVLLRPAAAEVPA
ncbi:MAG: zinc-binding dehydrogenase [Mycobacteriaceae bacterium]